MRWTKWLDLSLAAATLFLCAGAALAAPQNGWWWNSAESGRGFFIEKQGDTLFMGGYFYEADGRSTWMVSGGGTTDPNAYTGRLYSVRDGQTLLGAYKAPTGGDAGEVRLQFADATHGTLTWPGGTIPIERQVAGAGTASFQPTGWWWNSAESGRGYSIEVQGDTLVMVGFMYAANGDPVWYLSAGKMASPQRYEGALLSFSGGQAMSGPYKAPTFAAAGGILIDWTSLAAATLTLSDAPPPVALAPAQSKRSFGIVPQLVKVAAPAATATGVPAGTASSATLGAAGGKLATPDGKLALTIPAGALAADTVITIQPLTNLAHGRIGAAYRLTPEGQTFLKPVTLAFAYTDADVVGSAPGALGAAFQTAAGYWQWAGPATVDTTAKTVSVTTGHFSAWSLVKGLQLLPASKNVKVNGTVPLAVVFCFPQDDADLAPLGYSCDTEGDLAPLAAVGEWSVNGTPGGGGAIGTVSGNGSGAMYTAPAVEPSPNTVAVSARVTIGAKGTVLLVSNITIGGETWSGVGESQDPAAGYGARATLKWTLAGRTNNVAVFVPSGVATLSIEDCIVSPSSGPVAPSGWLYIDYNTTPPKYRGFGTTYWTMSLTCPPNPTASGLTAAALYLGGSGGDFGAEATGFVSADGTTIEGTDIFADGTRMTWKFTRDP